MFAYCNNSPSLTSDHTGKKLEIVDNCDIISRIANRIRIVFAISILSDDDLVVQGSSVKIRHRNISPAHPVGTELVRRLVDDDNTTTIDFSSSAERGSGTIPENMELGTERNCSIKEVSVSADGLEEMSFLKNYDTWAGYPPKEYDELIRFIRNIYPNSAVLVR